MKKKIVSIVLAIAMIATMCVSLTACGESNIDLNDYVIIQTNGYEGYGTASSAFDITKFEEDYGNTIKYTKEGEEVYANTYAEPAYALANAVALYGDLDVYQNLSNGDKITYHWEITDEYEEYIKNNFKVNLKYSDVTETVNDLKEITTFDAFDGVSVTYDGIAPNGSASIDVNSNLNSYDFTITPSYDLSNGDIITVSLIDEDPEYYIENYGAVPEEFSRDYTVEGLPYYVQELSQIPESGLNEMDAQAQDALRGRIASGSNPEQVDVASADLLGCYLLTPKEGFNTRDYNEIYLVYQVNLTLHNKDANGNAYDTPFSFYRYYEFTDGMVLADGTFSIDYSNYSIPNAEVDAIAYDYTERWEWNQTIEIGFYGYDNLDTLFNNVVTQNIESFNYESSVGVNATED